MSNPVGWSSIYPPQYMSNQDPNVSPVASRALMSDTQRLGLFGRRGPVTGADLPAVEARGQGLMDNAMTVAGAVNPVGIRAFHGSPHTFDRFDMSKMGTGEGAQTYGHGLYFAGNEGIARSYRDALSEKELLRQLHMTVINGERGSIEVQKAMAKIDEIVTRPKDAPPLGSMYEVNLRTSPERLLDWDKPLSADNALRSVLYDAARPSAESVYGATRSSAFNALNQSRNTNLTGEGVHHQLAKVLGGAENASAQLRNSGIDGIQYLDAGSRAAGEGSSNYVMFDDKLIDILRRYGILGTAGGGGAVGLLSQETPQQ